MNEKSKIDIAFESIDYLEEVDILRALKEMETNLSEEAKKWYSFSNKDELFEMLKMPYKSNQEMLEALNEKGTVLPNGWSFLECVEWVELQSAYQVLKILQKLNTFFLEEMDERKQMLSDYYEDKYEKWISLYRDRKNIEKDIATFFEKN